MFGVQVAKNYFVPKVNRLSFFLFNDGFKLLLLGFGSGDAFCALRLIFYGVHLVIDFK